MQEGAPVSIRIFFHFPFEEIAAGGTDWLYVGKQRTLRNKKLNSNRADYFAGRKRRTGGHKSNGVTVQVLTKVALARETSRKSIFYRFKDV